MSETPQEKEIAIIKDLKRRHEAAKTLNGARKEMMRVRNLYLREMQRLKDIETEKKKELKMLTIKNLSNRHDVGRRVIERVKGVVLGALGDA